MQHGQLLLSWDWAENTDTNFLPLKEMASRLDFPGDENVLKSDLCVLQKLEQYFALPFSLTGKTIDNYCIKHWRERQAYYEGEHFKTVEQIYSL